MTPEGKFLGRSIFFTVFLLLISFGLSIDEAYFKGMMGHTFYWIVVSAAFAGLARSTWMGISIIGKEWGEKGGNYGK